MPACFCSDWWGSAPLAMLLPQSSQVQAPRARSGARGLLQATGQRLVWPRATTRCAAQFAKCRLSSHHERKTIPSSTTLSGINYPSPSLKLSGSRADTSGPSSSRSCAFQSLPRSSMNRPATRLGNSKVATAQMP